MSSIPGSQIEFTRGKYAPPQKPERGQLPPEDLSEERRKNIIEIDADGPINVDQLPLECYADGAYLIVRPADAETEITFLDADDPNAVDGNIRLPEGFGSPTLTDPSHQAKFIYNLETEIWTLNSVNFHNSITNDDIDEILNGINSLVVEDDIDMSVTLDLEGSESISVGDDIQIGEFPAISVDLDLSPEPTVTGVQSADYDFDSGVVSIVQIPVDLTDPDANFPVTISGAMVHHFWDDNDYYIYMDTKFPFEVKTQGGQGSGFYAHSGLGESEDGSYIEDPDLTVTDSFLHWAALNIDAYITNTLPWANGIAKSIGNRVRHNGIVYQATSAGTTNGTSPLDDIGVSWTAVGAGPWEVHLREAYATKKINYLSLTERTTGSIQDMIDVHAEYATLAVRWNTVIGWVPVALMPVLWAASTGGLFTGYPPGFPTPNKRIKRTNLGLPYWGNQWWSTDSGTTTQNQLDTNAFGVSPVPSTLKTELDNLRNATSPDEDLIRNAYPYDSHYWLGGIEENLGLVRGANRTTNLEFAVISAGKDPSGGEITGTVRGDDSKANAWGRYNIQVG